MEQGWAVVPCPSPKHQHEECPCRYLGVQQGRAPASKPHRQHSSSPVISTFFFPYATFRWGRTSTGISQMGSQHLGSTFDCCKALWECEDQPRTRACAQTPSFPALLMKRSARAGSFWFLLLGATCRHRASGNHT